MVYKFKVGTTVQVVKDGIGNSLDLGFGVGHRGDIVEYDVLHAPQPYLVRRKKTGEAVWFNVKELKLVRGKKVIYDR